MNVQSVGPLMYVVSKKQKKASELQEQTTERRARNTACQSQKRASETEEQTMERRARNTASKSKSRASVSLQTAVDSFVAKTKQGPDNVCNSCH